MLKISPGLTKKSALILTSLILNTGLVLSQDRSLIPLETSLQTLISRVSQSVVTIEAVKSVSEVLPTSQCDRRIFNLIASGIVLDTTGYILAAASSVIDRDNILVIAEGQKIPARLVGIDYQSGLALLRADRPVGIPVEALDNYRCIGQLVVAMGNSFGLHASPSLGFCAGARMDGSLQFSAAISSGSIGGGIFDLSGKLIGAITGGIGEGKQAEAGLAVPASEIPGIVDYLKKNGNRLAGYLGVTLSDIEIAPPIEIRSPNVFAGGYQKRNRLIDRSIIVTEVAAESPASFVKVTKGDLIISIEGEEITSAVDFLYQIRKIRPGSVVQLGLLKQNQLFMTDVIIGQRPNLNSDTEISGFFANGPSQNADASIKQELQALKKAMQRLEQRISDKK